MKLTVFGATGGTGRHIVEQALRAGHRVTAVVRDPARLGIEPGANLDVVTADVLDPAAIAPAINGSDAVLSALGPGGNAPTRVCRDSAPSIAAAMHDSGVRRLLVVSNSGNYTEGDGLAVRLMVKPILRRMLRNAYEDMDAMEREVRASGLRWTIVRPPQLTDKPYTGTVRSSVDGNVRGSFRIARADLAGYLLDVVEDGSVVRKTISVAG